MGPTTPNFSTFNFNFSQQAGPSSPPQTPTTSQFQYRQYKTRRNGMYFSTPSPAEDVVSAPIDIPTSNRPQSTSSPFYTHHSELSPRSSSPTSSTHSSILSTSPHTAARSLSSSPNELTSSPPRLQKTRSRIISELKANFTVEEFRDSEYEDYSDSDSIIRPTQYEDAESERGSVRGVETTTTVQIQIPLPKREPTPPPQPIDPRILSTFNDLRCSDDEEEEEGYTAHQLWVEKQRAEKRRKRRSSSSFKRSLAQSIGSDTDEEDLLPEMLDANDPGSSARRLKRRTLDRGSLIFDDPPARIEEESYEEVVEMVEEGVREDLARTLPYFYQEDMELDTSSEEEEEEEEEDDDDDDEDDD